MRILVAQINPTIGDLAGNAARIMRAIGRGRDQGADLVLFPELVLTGYPPEDFLLLPHFMESVVEHLEKIVRATAGIAVIMGVPRHNPRPFGKPLCNSAALIQNRTLVDFADKMLLPTYDVFDERRYFEPGEEVKIWTLNGCKIAITICEDLWQHSGCLRFVAYPRDPIAELSAQNLCCLVNLSASPYSFDKFDTRLRVCLAAARSLECPIILCNQVGGNDSLIFDGSSLYVDTQGLVQSARGFTEDEMWIDLSSSPPQRSEKPQRNPIQDLYEALVMGIRDYFRKSGFTKACLGLSGGIDSAVVACIAAEALGAANVLALFMPSRYSSPESSRDAQLLAEHLAIRYQEISIEPLFATYLSVLAPAFDGTSPDVTEENLQARIRGTLLMALSNKRGYLVLSTGNKSELALGYSTLYGDMCGALAVIGDVTKERVYALARWINRQGEVIPLHTIHREPSAELRHNQRDRDTLPDYAIVDRVLEGYVEEHRSPKWIAEHFHYPLELVEELIQRIHDNEYKRRQSPPILRVSEQAFSAGRKFPIVQRWVTHASR